MANVHQAGLLNNTAKQFGPAKYSDLTIKCGGRSFHVHKAIVCRASPVLEASLSHGTTEAISSTIEHHEFDSTTVERFLTYIYTWNYTVDGKALCIKESEAMDLDTHHREEETDLDYEYQEEGDIEDGEDGDPEEGSHADEEAEQATRAGDTKFHPIQVDGSNINNILIAHARVYAIGVYYDVPSLRQLARHKFTTAGEGEWQANGFVEVIREVCSLTSESDTKLRGALAKIALGRIGRVINDAEVMKNLAGLPAIQSFTAELLKRTFNMYMIASTTHAETLAQRDAIIAEASTDLADTEERVEVLEESLKKAEWHVKQLKSLLKESRTHYE